MPRQVITSYGLEWPGAGTATIDAISATAYKTRQFITEEQIVNAIIGEAPMSWRAYDQKLWQSRLPAGWTGIQGISVEQALIVRYAWNTRITVLSGLNKYLNYRHL